MTRLVTLVIACATAASAAALNVPFFPQEKHGCGAASVAMVMYYWGERSPKQSATYPAPRQVYQRLYRPDRNGVLLADMKRYLEETGFRVFTLRGRWADIEEHLDKGRPIIVALRNRRDAPLHFAVAIGTEPDRVWLNDPTRKKASRLKRAEFEQSWASGDRWMLLATPRTLE